MDLISNEDQDLLQRKQRKQKQQQLFLWQLLQQQFQQGSKHQLVEKEELEIADVDEQEQSLNEQGLDQNHQLLDQQEEKQDQDNLNHDVMVPNPEDSVETIGCDGDAEMLGVGMTGLEGIGLDVGLCTAEWYQGKEGALAILGMADQLDNLLWEDDMPMTGWGNVKAVTGLKIKNKALKKEIEKIKIKDKRKNQNLVLVPQSVNQKEDRAGLETVHLESLALAQAQTRGQVHNTVSHAHADSHEVDFATPDLSSRGRTCLVPASVPIDIHHMNNFATPDFSFRARTRPAPSSVPIESHYMNKFKTPDLSSRGFTRPGPVPIGNHADNFVTPDLYERRTDLMTCSPYQDIFKSHNMGTMLPTDMFKMVSAMAMAQKAQQTVQQVQQQRQQNVNFYATELQNNANYPLGSTMFEGIASGSTQTDFINMNANISTNSAKQSQGQGGKRLPCTPVTPAEALLFQTGQNPTPITTKKMRATMKKNLEESGGDAALDAWFQGNHFRNPSLRGEITEDKTESAAFADAAASLRTSSGRTSSRRTSSRRTSSGGTSSRRTSSGGTSSRRTSSGSSSSPSRREQLLKEMNSLIPTKETTKTNVTPGVNTNWVGLVPTFTPIPAPETPSLIIQCVPGKMYNTPIAPATPIVADLTSLPASGTENLDIHPHPSHRSPNLKKKRFHEMTAEEKKQRNRESAERSRVKRKEYTDQLEMKCTQLEEKLEQSLSNNSKACVLVKEIQLVLNSMGCVDRMEVVAKKLEHLQNTLKTRLQD